MGDTRVVKGETYLPKAQPEGQIALTVIDVDGDADGFVYFVHHHVSEGVRGALHRQAKHTFASLVVPCHRVSTWRVTMGDDN